MRFADVVRRTAEERGVALAPATHPEPLAALDYAVELELKREALATFWGQQRLPGALGPILAAPAPRGYRTTTKRRAEHPGGRVVLTFPGAPVKRGLSPSVLDAPAHTAVYAFLVERLARPGLRPLAKVLNHVIVRGTAGALAVVLNLRVFDAPVVRAAKTLAVELQESPLGVRSGFLYLDPSASDYYLEARRPIGVLSFKRLFGPDFMQLEVEGTKLRFPPTVFSQVNGAMVPAMIEAVRSLLAPLDGHALLDLYCGYGLFSLTIGQQAGAVLGIDLDGPAIEAARRSAEHLGVAGRVRFLPGRIDAAFLRERVRPFRLPELVLLDPPRQGTAAEVADAIAARRPERVLHVACGIDEMPRELAAWEAAGLRARSVLPLDLFAGTAGLETLVLLAP